MKLSNILLIALGVIVTSCYLFPFVLASFPVGNSKMILAVIGLLILGYNLVKKNDAAIDKGFLVLSIWSIVISLIAGISTLINDTHDFTYAYYFMSMWVWLGGAYAAISLIRSIHGGVSVGLVANYLIVVCVAQCVLALVFNTYPEAESWSARIFAGEAFMGNTKEDRMHGIGCSLDVAGFRFACILTMIAFMIYKLGRIGKTRAMLLYMVAFAFITVIGNMISRSTVIGTVLGIIFLVAVICFQSGNTSILKIVIAVVLVTIPISVYLYNTDESFHENLRFGFEGFFNYFEKGEWRTNSNDILKDMVVWPDNLKTWLIGDGYINNPLDNSLDSFDPYYTGPVYHGYYMGSDIGYVRFIFYFGVIGLAAFSLFFVKVCQICVNRFPNYLWFFIMILTLNFLGWLKVASDLFMVFAPFLCISSKENAEFDKRYILGERG